MKKGLIILAVSCGLWGVSALQAQQRRLNVPASPWPIEHVQPNGDTLVIRMHGDERRNWRTTEDGYLIAQNKRGTYCYAKKNKKGETVRTCRRAHNKEDRRKCEKRFLGKYIPNTFKKDKTKN